MKKYDIIHFNGNDLQQLIISIFTSQYPKVHAIHDYIGHSGERNYWAELFNKGLFNSNKYKIIHSRGGNYQLQDQTYLQRKRISIIPYGPLEIYKAWANSLLHEENNNILFFGRISLYKGIEYLIRAVPIIKEKFPDVKVILAGENSYYFNIENLKKDNTYQIINRYIPNRELVELIQKSTLIACPYTDATQSGVIMTVYAFNKPIVATNVGGIPEVVEDNITGRLVPARNSQELAEAIIDLLTNPEKRRHMAGNIKAKFSSPEFNWDNIAQRTIEVYKKAVGK
jgi:glycosyltransferase involved in cell wall biosynthesis